MIINSKIVLFIAPISLVVVIVGLVPLFSQQSPPALGDTRTRPADGMVMVYVPSGEFQMGSTEVETNTTLEQCMQTFESDW